MKKSSSVNPSHKTQNSKKNVSKSSGFNLNFSLYAMLAALAVLTWVTFQPALDNDFVDWDDYTYVINNDLIRNSQIPQSEIWKRPVSLNYHPVTISTMRWNNNECADCMEGISARPFITWNVLIHIINTLLLFLWIRSLLGGTSIWRAGFVAAVFAVHPMHVESVAWVSERKDVLYTFFSLMGLLMYQHYVFGKDKRWLWAILPVFVLACLSKAMAVVLPVLFILVSYWHDQEQDSYWKKRFFKDVLILLPFFGVSLFFGLMAVEVQSGDNFLGLLTITGEKITAINEFDTFSLLQRITFASYGFVMYWVKFFVPTGLSTFYPYPTMLQYEQQVIYKIVFLFPLVIVSAAWFLQKKAKFFFFGTMFYLVTVALVLQFFSVGAVIMADRYTYMPYIGIAFMLIQAAWQYLPATWHKPLYGVSVIILLGFSVLSRKQIDVWQNSDTLWTNVINLYPETEQAYSNRGHFYGKMAGKAGDETTRNKYLEKSYDDFQKAVSLNTTRTEVFEGLGNIYGMRGNYEESLKQYTVLIDQGNAKGSVYFNRGVTYSLLGKFDAAAEDFTRAMELYPEKRFEALNYRALAWLQIGAWQKCIDDYSTLLSEKGDNADFYVNRGQARQNLGDLEGAKGDYLNALKINPQLALARERLSTINGN